MKNFGTKLQVETHNMETVEENPNDEMEIDQALEELLNPGK